ncbi:MAG: hypothetical protein ACRDP6_43560, partial [Actinoallomurus sp.]
MTEPAGGPLGSRFAASLLFGTVPLGIGIVPFGSCAWTTGAVPAQPRSRAAVGGGLLIVTLAGPACRSAE